MTLMQEIEAGLKEVKLMKEGKIPTRTFADLKKKWAMSNEVKITSIFDR